MGEREDGFLAGPAARHLHHVPLEEGCQSRTHPPAGQGEGLEAEEGARRRQKPVQELCERARNQPPEWNPSCRGCQAEVSNKCRARADVRMGVNYCVIMCHYWCHRVVAHCRVARCNGVSQNSTFLA